MKSQNSHDHDPHHHGQYQSYEERAMVSKVENPRNTQAEPGSEQSNSAGNGRQNKHEEESGDDEVESREGYTGNVDYEGSMVSDEDAEAGAEDDDEEEDEDEDEYYDAGNVGRERTNNGQRFGTGHQASYDTEEEMSEDVRTSDEEDDQGDNGESGSDSDSDAQDSRTQSEITKFLESFPGLETQYKLVSKIGEGTFSSVYKAVDLLHDRYVNDWDVDRVDESSWSSPPLKKSAASRFPGGHLKSVSTIPSKKKYVAIKKIYVTSSPARIQNELELLKDLSGCDNVVSLITAFRNYDQVVAVMPYFKHVDFRDYFKELDIPHIRLYFRPLFQALKHVHILGILHRDIKPTNFLYDVNKGHGVLVDFGLAEREDHEGTCLCQIHLSKRKEHRLPSSLANPTGCYPKNDSRPARRANRAGTRGFRAPEVLFKCPAQTTKIDIWSAGVILLTFLAKRFPFFNSTDDIDAIIEIATIFGKSKMRTCAELHGATFEANLSTITDKGFMLEKVILWATGRSNNEMSEDERLAIDFLYMCMDLDPVKRISAKDALEHPFLGTEHTNNVSDDEIDLI